MSLLNAVLPREVTRNVDFGLSLAKALVGGREDVVAGFLENLVGGLPRSPQLNPSTQPVFSPAQRQSDMLEGAKQAQGNLQKLTDLLEPNARIKLFDSFNKRGGAEHYNQSRRDGVGADSDMIYVARQLKDDPRPGAQALGEKLLKQAEALTGMIEKTEIPYETQVGPGRPELDGNRLQTAMAEKDLRTANKIWEEHEARMKSGHDKLTEASNTFADALEMLERKK